MAKDGTMRGGQRVGAGRKSKALADKIVDGRLDGAMVLPEPTEIEGADIPPVKEYLKASQKNGKDLCAEEVYRDTWNWLKARGCETLVNNQLIEQYAMSVSRWIQCEEAISEFGFLAKHPTTGNAIASPYVAMSQTYMKQVNQVWYQIYLKWNNGEIPVALIHPASAGHGLNLQTGGSTIVWFGLTWSLELYSQTIARLWRQGQTSETVVVQHIVKLAAVKR